MRSYIITFIFTSCILHFFSAAPQEKNVTLNRLLRNITKNAAISFGTYNHNDVIRRKFAKYQKDIDAKINRLTIKRLSGSYPVCPFRPPFFGEFGVELYGYIPWIYATRHTQRCNLKTIGALGSRYLYFFSSNHTIVDVKRNPKPLPIGNAMGWTIHVSENTTDWSRWRSPPWRLFFKSEHKLLPVNGKPLLLIFNKFSREWKGNPVNFIPLETLSEIIEDARHRFQIVYIRMEIKQLQDHQDSIPFKDKTMLMQKFPDVYIFDDLFLDTANSTDLDMYNLFLFGLAAQCKYFLSVQGGTSIIASLFGGENIIFIKKGNEMAHGYGAYTRLGNTTISSTSELSTLVIKMKQLGVKHHAN